MNTTEKADILHNLNYKNTFVKYRLQYSSLLVITNKGLRLKPLIIIFYQNSDLFHRNS